MNVVPLPPTLHRAAVALWHETGLTRPWNDPDDDLRQALDGPSSTVLAALDGDVLLGTAMVGHDGHRGWVYYLGVSPVAQRRGVGTALMRAAEAWLHERGVPAVNLMVRTGNDTAVTFYESLGYETMEVVTMATRLDGRRRKGTQDRSGE